MSAETRNQVAWKRAQANPEAVARAAATNEAVRTALEAYSPPWTDKRIVAVDPHEAVRIAHEARDAQTPEWRAFMAGWQLRDFEPGYNPVVVVNGEEAPEGLREFVLRERRSFLRHQAEMICEHLASLPAGDDLALLTLVVEAMPHKVTPTRRKDRRILPRVVEGAHHPDRERGMLFGGLHEGRRIEAPELPLFPDTASAKRVPMLDLVDAAGLPVMARGRGVPLPLRLFVRALASIEPPDRRLESVRMALTLRELRDGLYPNGWRSGQHWPELRHALLHARDYAIHDGRGRWFPVALRYMPDTPDLEDLVVLDVAYPPGSHSGPTVSLPAMDQLSVTSAPRWRAYIAAHSIAWQPGTTRVPAPRAGGRYLWTRNRSAYPLLTVEDRLRLAFGEPSDNPNRRTRAAIDAAFRDLPGLVMVSERAVNERTGEVGWLVIPEDAAKALTHPEDGAECRHSTVAQSAPRLRNRRI